MYVYRNRFTAVSTIALVIALLLTIRSFVSFTLLLALSIIGVVALSLIADAIVLFTFYRRQESLLQLVRGLLLFSLFFVLLVQVLLKRL